MAIQHHHIDTKEAGCPEFMLDIRMGLKALSWNDGDHVFVTIRTKSKTAPREVPAVMKMRKFNIIEQTETVDADGYYTYVVSPTDTCMMFDPSQAEQIPVVLLDRDGFSRDLELVEKFNTLVDEFTLLLTSGFTPVYPCSFGKDSMVILHAGLEAHRRLIRNKDSGFDVNTPLIVIHIDTAIEVIPMVMFSDYAMNKLRSYCEQEGINLDLHHVQPPLHEQYVPLFVSARKLPSTPSMNSDCAVIMKVDQSEAIQRKLIEKFGYNRLVTCLGSRLDESAKRAASIERHGSLNKTAESIIQKNDKGMQSCAPIRHWSTEDVFEFLQRVGEQPATKMSGDLKLPSFMNSARLLLKIYGQSAKDTCEINVGATEGKNGCGGKARNGCHQCFKAGRQDSSATAQNEYARWGTIQKNATAVRDWVFARAHDIQYRTLHPRTFDPVTNHVMLQPNILNSRFLEKMFWFYTQLSYDDLQRSLRFKSLLASNSMMDDEGYAEIANDASMDEITRKEHLEMYTEGAQKHLINMVTLEHAILVSAMWAMDGVKSLPFRPLAIFNSIFHQGKRLPYPKAGEIVNSDIPDALALPLAKPGVDLMGLWSRPARAWDILDNDQLDGCFEENIPNSLRVRVEMNTQTNQISVVAQGVSIAVGAETHEALREKALQLADENNIAKFASFLTYRKMAVVGERLLEQPRARNGNHQFTRRSTKVNRKTGAITRHRTSLQMYTASPQSALAKSWTQPVEIWVPDFVKTREPYIAQTVIGDDEDINYNIDPQSLANWLDTGGMDAAIAVHDRAAKSARRQRRHFGSRLSMRVYGGTAPFWTIMQSGVLRVTENTRNTCYSTLRRTEVFAEAGLFDFPDYAEAFTALDQCKTMKEHRSFKAKMLLQIRAERNLNRRVTQQKIEQRASDPDHYIFTSLLERATELMAIRQNVVNIEMIDADVMTALDLSAYHGGPSTSDRARIAREWDSCYGRAFISGQAFVDAFASSAERQMMKRRGDLLIKLDRHLKQASTNYIHTLRKHTQAWEAFFREMHDIYRSSRQLFAAQSICVAYEHVLFPLSDSHMIALRLSGNERTYMAIIRDSNERKSDAFFDKKWTDVFDCLAKIKARHDQMESDLSAGSSVATMSGKAKSKALLSMLA